MCLRGQAMLHRQSEEIPPLMPSGPAAPAAPAAAAAGHADVGGLLPHPQVSPAQPQQPQRQVRASRAGSCVSRCDWLIQFYCVPNTDGLFILERKI